MRKLILLILACSSVLVARQKTQVHHTGAEIPYEPWLTGPLLSPTPVNMEPRHPSIEPNLTVLNTYGRYDSNWKYQNEDDNLGISLIVDFQFAITKNTGIEIIADATLNMQDGKTDKHFNDTIILFGYQLSHDKKNTWVPDCRLFIQTIYPSGKHDRLDPKRPALSVTGQGAYFVGPAVSFQKLFYLPCNFLMLHWGFGYNFPTRAKVRDFSVYGGGFDTKGSIRPGQFLNASAAIEYSFSQRWAFATDIFLTHQFKTSGFEGNPGIDFSGNRAEVGLPSSTQISITPSFEYSFSPKMGLLFGSWFTIAGRNASAFASGFVSFLYVF